MSNPRKLRTLAIIAHVDHGKTTLVDALFQQGGVFHKHQQVVDRVMDSNDQERERGITITAKTTSVQFDDLLLQIVDTPGHADFGGEVERALLMVDGVVLLVDAAEGPLPQTRFVMRKAFSLGLPAIVVINKMDRSDARAEEVLNEVYDLFIDLGADDAQLSFPVLYAVAKDGWASTSQHETGRDLKPLVAAIEDSFAPRADRSSDPFVMRVNQLAYDSYVGRLLIGRVEAGVVKVNDTVMLHHESGQKRGKISGVFSYHGIERITRTDAVCGDIIALAGLEDATVGDSVSSFATPNSLPRISVDEPTVAMVFQINDGPFSGRSGGKFITSRQLGDRLRREVLGNVSIRIKDGDTPDHFRVLGRGELQLAVLIETLRREKFELCVRNPEVVTREGDNGIQEPTERLVVDVPLEHLGAITELIGGRRATLLDQRHEGDRVRCEYVIPTRGLFGLRGASLTLTRGTAMMHSVFEGWTDWSGPIAHRSSGALVSDRQGKTTPYALFHLQPRGTLFIPGSTQVYEGMIIGEHNRSNDLNVNAVREKKQTNVRAAGKDEATTLAPPREMTLERSLEWMRDDEMLEVTPDALRLRKRNLKSNRR